MNCEKAAAAAMVLTLKEKIGTKLNGTDAEKEEAKKLEV
jgi:hypothetical protein